MATRKPRGAGHPSFRAVTGGLVIIVLLLSSCGIAGDDHDQRGIIADRETRVLTAPLGTAYLDALWRDPQHLIVAQVAGPKLRPRLGVVDARTGAFSVLPVAERTGCEQTGSSFPTRLGSNAIAYLSTCYGGDGTPDRINQIRRFDLSTRDDRALFPYFVLPFTGSFTFAPDGRRGLLNDGYGLQEHLRWLLPRGTRIVQLPGIVRAGIPSWEPDGDRVVFDAVEAGFQGDIAIAPRTLFIADARHLARRRLLVRGMTNTIGSGVSWVPGRPWVVYPMQPPHGQNGLWLIDVVTGAKVLLESGSGFGRAAVSSDGWVAVPIGVDTAERGMTVSGGIKLFHLHPDLIAAALARQ
jgi:hypothetical protein